MEIVYIRFVCAMINYRNKKRYGDKYKDARN
jgi:hypothetical protein